MLITSSFSLAALKQLPKLEAHLSGSCYHCFGEHTARCLRAIGLDFCFHQEARGAKELCLSVMGKVGRNESIAILSAQSPAADMQSILRREGYGADSLFLYRTECRATLADGSDMPRAVRMRICAKRQAICFASPSSVRGFYRTFSDIKGAWERNFFAVAIGDTTMKAVRRHFFMCATASKASTKALFLEAVRQENYLGTHR